MLTADPSQPSMGAPAVAPQMSGGGTYYAPPPGSVGAAQDYAGATDAYKRALIRFNSQRSGLLQKYGYAGDVDPTSGMVKNVRVDAGNTYGGLQQLLRSQALEDRGAEYAAEDRGLHGGLANQGVSDLRYAHGNESGQLAQNLFGGLSDLNSQQLDAKNVLDAALWQLQHQATSQAVDNGDFNPALLEEDPGTAGAPASAATSPAVQQAVVAAARARMPMARAPRMVTAATRRGEPTSEHGLGSLGNVAKKPSKAEQVAKVIANAYTSGKKKRG